MVKPANSNQQALDQLREAFNSPQFQRLLKEPTFDPQTLAALRDTRAPLENDRPEGLRVRGRSAPPELVRASADPAADISESLRRSRESLGRRVQGGQGHPLRSRVPFAARLHAHIPKAPPVRLATPHIPQRTQAHATTGRAASLHRPGLSMTYVMTGHERTASTVNEFQNKADLKRALHRGDVHNGSLVAYVNAQGHRVEGRVVIRREVNPETHHVTRRWFLTSIR